jgi:Protein of unknown function (DUF1706)
VKKTETLQRLKDSREAFLKAIDGLTDEAMVEPGVVGEWSLRDLFVHLTLWEAELVTTLYYVKLGRKPPAGTVTSESMDQKNARWHAENKDRPLERARTDFAAVRQQTLRRVRALTQAEIDHAEKLTWLEGAPLEKWIASDTYEHEAEHLQQIREWRERRERRKA